MIYKFDFTEALSTLLAYAFVYGAIWAGLSLAFGYVQPLGLYLLLSLGQGIWVPINEAIRAGRGEP